MPIDYTALGRGLHARILGHEEATAEQLVNAYQPVWERLNRDLQSLWIDIQAGETGSVPPTAWRLLRITRLLDQIETEINRYALDAVALVTTAQAVAAFMAHDEVIELLKTVTEGLPAGIVRSFSTLSRPAIEVMVGNLGNRSPLTALFDTMGTETSTAAKQVLISGMVRGIGPREVAREMSNVAGVPISRALAISRTETLRAYRYSSHATMESNNDVLQGWLWFCELGPRTCPSCIAMHGTFHALQDTLDDHVNGRCVAMPVTKTDAELGISGFTDRTPQIESGESWFNRQPDSLQREIVGNKGYEAIRDGQASIRDFVKQTHSEEWGSMRSARSVDGAIQLHGHSNPASGSYQIPGR